MREENMKRCSIIILTMGFLSSCMLNIPEYPDTYRINHTEQKVMISSTIDKYRKNGVVRITNKSKVASFCPNILIRVITDNPNTYLETGENLIILGNVFLGERETMQNNISTESLGLNASSHIRSIYVETTASGCNEAGFLEFCQYNKKKNERQVKLINTLSQNYRVSTCEGLSIITRKKKRIDLSGAGDIDAELLSYFEALIEINFDKTEHNLIEAKKLERISKSAFINKIILN